MSLRYDKIKLIIAITILVVSVLILLAFNSHWTNSIEDQSEILNVVKNYENTNNMIGGVGAQISEFFIRMFGASAYLLISFMMVISLKIIFDLNKINIIKTLSKHIFLLIWFSLFFTKFSNPKLAGQLGLNTSEELIELIGEVGFTIILISSLLLFFIVRFNIGLKDFEIIKQKILNSTQRTIIQHKEESPLKKQVKDIKETETIQTEDLNKHEHNTIVEIAKEEDVVNQNKTSIDQVKNDVLKYKYPELTLLKEYPKNKISINESEVETNKKLIEDTLRDFKIDVQIKRATIGPTITLYEIIPNKGVQIAKIKNLENDIALRIKAIGVRIIAPLPGKGTVGIEVPNQNPTIVSMKNVLESEKFQNAKLELPIALGKTIANETFVLDLTKMPHLLIAGATGQGKSVGLNTILCSILYKKHPSEVKFILVDPKKVELTLYNKIENHFLAKLPDDEDAIITDTKNVVKTLKSLCVEMDKRYDLLKKLEVRNIQEYNEKVSIQKLDNLNLHSKLPYLVLVIDEFADLIMTAGKEVEVPIARLAQLSRAIGIHLIIATQRPTTNIITGTIKANFPTRIAFRVIQGVDSKTILDSVGANQLIGRGDMLISTGSSLERIQCAFIDTPEVEQLTNFIGNQPGYDKPFQLPKLSDDNRSMKNQKDEDRDPLFREAAVLLVLHQQGSTSMIQRKLKLGYNRAGRIIDQLEAAGILGPLKGSKGRKVLIETEEELNQII